MSRARLRDHIEAIWYGGAAVPGVLALLERVYAVALRWRRALYASGWWRSERVALPVIVVGNLTVGGTGKTPLTIWLADELCRRGWRPGVILRGYGGRARGAMLVEPSSNPESSGEEALLIARTARVPVAVAARRIEAARLLVARGDCDVLIADDGLQHWALQRDLEILVIDGARRFGNGRLLPAGPLREPASRLRHVDFVVANGAAGPGEIPMQVAGTRAQNLLDPTRVVPLASFRGQAVHAVAGIGNPARFFAMLERLGLEVIAHPLPDHHAYRGGELDFRDELPVLLTEKDATKCVQHAHARAWVVAVEAELPPEFAAAVHAALHALKRART